MKIFRIFGWLFFVLLFLIFQTDCANVVAPIGGPKDSLPPLLLYSLPKDSTTHFSQKKIVFVFNEYIKEKDILKKFYIQPLTKTIPEIKVKLNKLYVKLIDTLKENTTYSLVFNKAIVDLREENPYNYLIYCFSTGMSIDSQVYGGTVMNAETGSFDSTVIVVLYKDYEDDSIVFKKSPDYYSPVSSTGKFEFNFLPKDSFRAFVISNTFNKKYLDSTTAFAFLNHLIYPYKDTSFNQDIFYFYKSKKIEKPKAKPKLTKTVLPKLSLSSSIKDSKLDILVPLKLDFTNKIKVNDSFPIQLTDTLYNSLPNTKIIFDTVNNSFLITYAWPINRFYKIIIPDKAISDTFGQVFTGDTISFKTFEEAAYGKLVIRIKNTSGATYNIVQLVKNDEVLMSLPLDKNSLTIPYIYPDEYSIRLIEDLNNNGKWDKGYYSRSLKLQPEKTFLYPEKIKIKAQWDNSIMLNY